MFFPQPATLEEEAELEDLTKQGVIDVKKIMIQDWII